MGVSLSKFGDWGRAGIVLHSIAVKLFPAFVAKFEEDGEFVVDTMKGHIDAQDLPWTPLSARTVSLKGGETIYVETGTLRDSIKATKLSSSSGITIFVGPTASGGGDAVLMWMEYGNSRVPARPLIRPTYEEVAPILRGGWADLLREIITGG